MNETFSKIWEVIKSIWTLGRNDFWGGFMTTLLVALFLIFKRRIINLVNFLVRLKEKYYSIPKILQVYTRSLLEETFRLNHSWKLEGQSLKNIFVPVNIHTKGTSVRTNLNEFVLRQLQTGSTPKYLLLGDAGSGKSISLGQIARIISLEYKKTGIIPIIIPFSEMKLIGSNKNFEKLITEKICKAYSETNEEFINQITFHVKDKLRSGKIVLLLDGLDELEKSIRFEIARFLDTFLVSNNKIPFFISCRIKVWNQYQFVFPTLEFQTIYMAEFTPFEIYQFVSQWFFTGDKSPERLFHIINNKPYLKSLSANPLFLTIVTFLYAQPKRVLPDNRVKFYAECIEALLEKWDNTKSIDRANQFEAIDKISILSLLAYEHIINNDSTDEDIHKKHVFDVITSVMKSTSRPIEKREKLLIEIVQNSELLIELPPDEYKFPHRTFLEYFAANYFDEKNFFNELLDLYDSDKGKWQETLALYCGMNLNSEISDKILTKLNDNFIASQKEAFLDSFVFKALLESVRITPSIAEKILQEGESYLLQNLNPDIIENLGYIAVNPNWNHSRKAKEILLNLFHKSLSNSDLQLVSLALINLKDPEIKGILLSRLDSINLTDFIRNLGSHTQEYALNILETISSERVGEVILGFKEAGNFEFLFDLLTKSNQNQLKRLAAVALALSSNNSVFFTFLEKLTLGNISPIDSNIAEEIFKRYTWPGYISGLANRDGQKAVFLISHYCSEFIIAQPSYDNIIYTQFKDIHIYLRYLISSLLHEKNLPFSKYNLCFVYPQKPIRASTNGLVFHWKKRQILKGNFLFNCLLWLYPIINIILAVYQFHDTNGLQIIIGTLAAFGIISIAIITTEPSREDRMKISYVLFFITIPLILLSNRAWKGSFTLKMAYSPVFYLAMGMLLFIFFSLLPLPGLSKIFNLILILILTIISFFNCYISQAGIFLQNDEIDEALN